MKTVERTFEILELLSKYGALSLKEISTAMRLPPNKCWNLLNAIRRTGYIITIRRGIYCTGEALSMLGFSGKEKPLSEDLKSRVAGICRNLRAHMVISELQGTSLHVRYSAFANDRQYFETPPGLVLNTLYRWATGRVLLAGGGENFIRMYVAKHGLPDRTEWNRIRDIDTLLEECRLIQQTGFAEIKCIKQNTRAFAIPLERKIHGCSISVGITFPESEHTKIYRETVLNNLRLL